MDFRFTDDQELFADTVRDILANECPPSAVRAASHGRASFSPMRRVLAKSLQALGLCVVPLALFYGIGLRSMSNPYTVSNA